VSGRQRLLPAVPPLRTVFGALALMVLATRGAAAQGGGGAGAPPPSPPPGQLPSAQPIPTGTPRAADPRAADPRAPKNPKDTTKKNDAKGPLVDWGVADSVTLDLLKRKGYNVVRYKATEVSFSSDSRTILLIGDKKDLAAVERDPTQLVSDTISYTDTSTTLRAKGTRIVMRDPSRGEDVVAHEWMNYDVELKQGSMRDVETAATSGQRWIVKAHRAAFSNDTTAKEGNTFYGRDGIITSCEDSIPHYDFVAKELKRISGNWVVARPAVLYIQDVPVAWLPFIFQDARSGRRSGVLTPRFGLAELVRNSPTYRRNIENIGYYLNLSEYYDAAFSLDWRSAANATDFDPGWTRLSGEIRYRWLNRFVSGRLAMSKQSLSSGLTNTSLSWAHQQDFSIHSRLTMNANYVTSTTVQRQTSLNALQAIGTIASQVNYQRDMGLVSMSLGGTRRQYPGRSQVDQDLPSLNITSKPIDLATWALWTPSFSTSTSSSLHLDQSGDFTRRYFTRSDGSLDSSKVDRNTRTTQMSFNSPFKFQTPFKDFELQINTGVTASDRLNDFPEIQTIVDPNDTTRRISRVFARTYLSQVNWDFTFGLPSFFQGTWNLAPSVALSNVDPGAFFVRSHFTGSKWVSQSKRPNFSLSISPTFFGLFPGFGSVARFRHSVTPNFQYSYAPAATVNNEYLLATARNSTGYLGNLAQNRVTMSLTQSIEAKMKQGGDSAVNNPEAARKIKVVSLTFTPITYDFERAAKTGKTGLATDRFGYTMRSDLLPGLDFGSDYSLFQGNVLSDTAKFSPYLESIRASFNLNAESAIVKWIGKLFGGGPTPVAAPLDTSASSTTDRPLPGSRLQGSSSVAGQSMRENPQGMGAAKGFDASFTFTKNQQRTPTGNYLSRDFDVTVQCQGLKDINPLQYELCVRAATTNSASQDITNTQTTGAGTFVKIPPQTNIQARLNFNLTEKWASSYSTNYDMERSEFGAQTVSLQRDMHDWRAIFGFTQAPNGNFSFTFFISLKAEPDLKFNYDRASYRQQAGSVP
jgi:lipopolysaccharide assembly outer membrane protein LptD (OstA)